MARRHPDDSESLDLLLDTITNVFGSIILISVLIALLTGQKSASLRQEQQSLDALAARGEARELQALIEQAEADLADAQQWLSDPALEADDQRAKQQEWLKRQIAAAQDQLRQLEQSESEAEASADPEQLRRRLQQLREQLQRAQQALSEQQKAERVPTRLPRERPTDKRQVLLLLRGDRAYFLQSDEDVRTQPQPGGGTRYLTRAGGGVLLRPDQPAPPRLQAVFRRLGPDSHFFDIVARPDAAAAFAALRRLMNEHDYRYNVHFLPAELPLVLYPTHSVSAQ